MNVRELRIGNVLFIPGLEREVIVSAIFRTHFVCEDKDGIRFEESLRINYQPVQLTEEWLLKFGFIAFDDKTFIHDSLRYSDKFKFREDGVLAYVSSEVYITDLKYVHQLQNLYFALTGEELTYGGNKWK